MPIMPVVYLLPVLQPARSDSLLLDGEKTATG